MEPDCLKRKRDEEEECEEYNKEAKYPRIERYQDLSPDLNLIRSSTQLQPRFNTSVMPLNPNRVIESYVHLGRIGEGAYGNWYMILDKTTDQKFAVKKITTQAKDDKWSKYTLRHANIGLSLEHKHLRLVFDVIGNAPNSLGKRERAFLIAEYSECTLQDLLQGAQWMKFSFSERQAKKIVYQLLLAVEYLHKSNVIHRDISPEHIMLMDGEVKLDMTNLIREYTNDGTMTPNVVSLMYRAPELLLGLTKYDFAIDMWSVGCIMAELFLCKPLFNNNGPLFPSQTGILAMLNNIAEVLGPIRPHHWPELADLKPEVSMILMNASESRASLTQIIPHLSRTGHELLAGLLCYNPRDRVSARQALQHAWFDDVSQQPLQYQQVHRSVVVLSEWL